MRKPALALVTVLLAALSGAAPAVAAPSALGRMPAVQGIQATASEPKVVIIVGATHGTTPRYRAYADEAYAEAIQYTSNVVKVYSPDATWERVKAAVAGASVVIYMGHGNGWPSPYTYDSNYTTKDGFGLNATAGAGDHNNKYYGEPSIATLDLAPGAVILLHHLCYAAGNSEPGHGEPSVSVARERVDNYAAGFLKAGAAAVIADGHSRPGAYLRALFTMPQTIEQIWAGQHNGNGNIVSFPSVRTPGATAFQDPRTPTSGFYRSLVVRTAGVTLDNLVTGGGGGLSTTDTSIDPPGVKVPGNAAPAQLLALTPGPATTSWLSPNGDGNRETVTFKATASESGTFAVSVRDVLGTRHRSWTVTAGAGATAVAWDGRDEAGAPVADGAYVVSIAARDAAGNTGPGEDRAVNVVTALSAVTTSTPVFYPQDLDQFAPTTELSFSLSRSMVVTWTLRDAAAKVVDTRLAGVALDAGTHTWTFDGRRSDGTMLPPGRYLSHVVATDGALVAAQSVAIEADAFLVKPSDATPARGQAITITVTSAEPLAANPRLTILQPGLAAWSVATVRLSSTTWHATLKLKAGSTGFVTFKATGKDIAGATQSTARRFPLH